MKVAILSDIHGNRLALDAVLADINQAGNVDEYWLLGDYCTVGYDPAGVLDRLAELPNATFIRGNGERYIATGQRPPPSFEDVNRDPSLLPNIVEVAGSFAWTSGAVSACGWMDWVSRLPLEYRTTLPDGTQVLLVHAEPGMDDGEGLNPGLTEADLNLKLQSCGADLICVGHFHLPIDRKVANQRIINPGCLSNPIGTLGLDLRPSYAILNANVNGYSIEFRRVSYDLSAALSKVNQCGIPGNQFIQRSLTGLIGASWLKNWDGKSHLSA